MKTKVITDSQGVVLSHENIDNPNENMPNRPDVTFLEYEISKTKASELNKTVFFVDNFPDDVPYKYIKKSGDVFEEMTSEEKTQVDLIENYNQKKGEFKGFRFKITVSLSHILENYLSLAFHVLGKQSIYNDVDDQNNAVVFCNEIWPSHQSMIENDPQFTIEDVEIYNPQNQ